MKPFRFSLQALQTLRERQEQLARQDYGTTLRAWETARNRTSEAGQELEGAWRHGQAALAAGCAALELTRLQAYCKAVEQRKQALESEEIAARTKVRQAFARLLAARKARAMVDKCFENQKQRYQRERRRWEQKALDEVVNNQRSLAGQGSAVGQPLWN